MNQSVTEDAGICLECGYPLELVRPGKVQCNYCELLNMYEEELYNHAKTRRTLEAMIEENDRLQGVIADLMRGNHNACSTIILDQK